MTVEIFEPAPIYTIQNAGPFEVPHPYETGTIRAAVIIDGSVEDLDPADYTVTPAASVTGGDIFLPPEIAALYDGARLTIWRETPEEQGWLGILGEREKGLETQLDRLTMVLQELRETGNRSLRSITPIQPFAPEDGRTIIFEGGQPAVGPSASEIGAAQGASEAALGAASRSEAAAEIVRGLANFTVADTQWLLDSTEQFPLGASILSRAEAGSYQVVEPAAAHLTTAGGVPLYVRPKEGILPLEHFGVRSSTGDCSAQMLMAVRESILQKAIIALPAFDLHLEAPVTLSLVGDFVNGNVSMRGGGPGQSRIIVDGASNPAGALLLDSPNSRGCRFNLQGFAVLADGTVAGRPIRATMLAGGSRQNSSLILRDIECMGLKTSIAVGNDTDYFTQGVNISGNWRAQVSNVRVTGNRGAAGGQGDYSNGSISYAMSEGIRADACYDCSIDLCRFSDAVTGVYSYDVGDVSSLTAEVFRIYRTQIDMVRIGIDHFRPGMEPHFYVSDCYINYRDVGVRVKGVRLGAIKDCMIDQKDIDNNATNAPADISLEFVKDFTVSGNHGNFVGDTRRRQVQILDTDATPGKVTQNIRVSNNDATGTFAAILYKGADTGRVDYAPGDTSGATVTVHVVDNSAVPPIMSLPRPYSGRVRRVAAQAIGNASYSTISFDTLAAQDLADIWTASAPATINVPDGRGVRKAKITAYTIFAASATGRREMRLVMNGSPVSAGFMGVVPAINGAPTRITAASEWLDVLASDSFTVEVYQDSGAALNVTAYLEAEFR